MPDAATGLAPPFGKLIVYIDRMEPLDRMALIAACCAGHRHRRRVVFDASIPTTLFGARSWPMRYFIEAVAGIWRMQSAIAVAVVQMIPEGAAATFASIAMLFLHDELSL